MASSLNTSSAKESASKATTDTTTKVAVCSRSFSRNPTLRAEIQAKFAHVTFNDTGRTLAGAELIEFIRGHERAVIALEKITEPLLNELPGLRVIGKYGVGLDGLDLAAMRRHNVKLGWLPGVNRRSVSEMTLALMILMLRRLPQANSEVRRGFWQQHVGNYLTGRTIGIVGLGRIGRDLVGLLEPFGCRILFHDILDYPEFRKLHMLEKRTLQQLFSECDIVSLHVPLDDSSRKMISARELSLLKPGALLVNCARGGLVDEQALKEQLLKKRIFAAFDVFETEPPTDLELVNLENFFVTPHLGGSAEEAILAMGRAAIAGLSDFKEAAIEEFALDAF